MTFISVRTTITTFLRCINKQCRILIERPREVLSYLWKRGKKRQEYGIKSSREKPTIGYNGANAKQARKNEESGEENFIKKVFWWSFCWLLGGNGNCSFETNICDVVKVNEIKLVISLIIWYFLFFAHWATGHLDLSSVFVLNVRFDMKSLAELNKSGSSLWKNITNMYLHWSFISNKWSRFPVSFDILPFFLSWNNADMKECSICQKRIIVY